jgi:hypothetical protein
MTTTNPFINRPTWEEVIDPLADSPLWVHIRQAASIVLEHLLHNMGDFDSGISSSDINHTVFGTASWLDRSSPTYPGDVLTALVHQGYESRP